jgi:hypothetical protein
MPVIDMTQIRRFRYAGGREFGDTGPYEQINAVLTFAVDPLAEANQSVIDLDRAPRDSEGLVRFTSDFSVLKPVDPERGAHRLLIELPNRGRRGIVNAFNRAGAEPAASAPPGDGFLFERGLTVASIGWQWDVYADDVLMGLTPPIADLSGDSSPGRTIVEIRPNMELSTWLLADRVHKPLRVADLDEIDAVLYIKDFEDGEETVIPRAKWKFARDTDGDIEPSDEHIYLEGGFQPGKYYHVVYTSKDSPIAGSGLLALRDVTSFLKFDSTKLMPDLGRLDHAIGFGASQTGRMLRHFLYQGFNVDEQGRQVLDGMLPHVAGARRGTFNHRYAQPSTQSYPSFGHMFPFADDEQTDPMTERTDGLLNRLREANAAPKVVYTNSSAEYWRGDCSLMHTNPEGRQDLEIGSSSRMYHFAGTQHGAGSLPQSREGAPEGGLGRYAYNVVDYSPLLRAALVNLEKWVSEGIEPPASVHAQIGKTTAVSRDDVLSVFDRFPDQLTPDRSKMYILRTVDLGSRTDDGIGEYPTVEGDTYTCLVSAVDGDGNEVAGIRLPDITQPVASHTGWNLRDPETGSSDQQIAMMGFSRWFTATQAERESAGDPRLSIEERYPDRDEYREQVTKDAESLVREGYVLEQDLDLVVQNAVDRYDFALSIKSAATVPVTH